MKTVTARATVNLSGLRAGQIAQVNPNDPRVADLLRTGLLVSEEHNPPAAEPPAEPRGRGAVSPQENAETSGDAEPASTRRRPRASNTPSDSATG